jgi:hypothetical protein
MGRPEAMPLQRDCSWLGLKAVPYKGDGLKTVPYTLYARL